MSADDLQKWASFLRWGGFVVTAFGLCITFAGYRIADRLIVAQRAEKIVAQKASAEIQRTLDLVTQPRTIPPLGVKHLLEQLRPIAAHPRKILIGYKSGDRDSAQLAFQLYDIFKAAGFPSVTLLLHGEENIDWTTIPITASTSYKMESLAEMASDNPQEWMTPIDIDLALESIFDRLSLYTRYEQIKVDSKDTYRIDIWPKSLY